MSLALAGLHLGIRGRGCGSTAMYRSSATTTHGMSDVYAQFRDRVKDG